MKIENKLEKCSECSKVAKRVSMALINGKLVCVRCVIDKKMIKAA